MTFENVIEQFLDGLDYYVKNYDIKYAAKIKELKLNTKEQVLPLNDNEAERLLSICNEQADNIGIGDIVNGSNNGVFSNYIFALACKIVLLYGSKNAVLNELKFDDYDVELNKLKINGFCVLKEIRGNAKAQAIAKYSIMKMIRLGLPAHVIMEFTGYANDVYMHCQELVDEEDGILMMSEKSKLLDSALRRTEIYDEGS